jgi:hypothetical protein
MGNQIYFKIAGKKKNWSKGRTARHILCKLEKRGDEIKKIFLSETTEPISAKLCWNDSWVVLLGKKKIDRRVEPPDTFLEENHPMTISSKFCSYWANGLIFFTEVIKFYWLMLLLYPGELYRLLGASSFVCLSFLIEPVWMYLSFSEWKYK